MTDLSPARSGAVALFLALLALPAPASSQPHERDLQVVWVRGDLAYVVSRDSTTLKQGELVTFLDRGKPIASGEVTRVYDGVMLVAKLSSGSLARIKNLDRLRIMTAPARLRAIPVLRVGYPARGRSNLVFSCLQMTLTPPSPWGAYRAEVLSESSYRLVRDSDATNRALSPDTLLIQLFDEVADQEIALERGELDVAVFWPGELSAQVRGDSRWQVSHGVRSRGIIAAFSPAGSSGNDSSAAMPERVAFASLNQQLFRGDLVPWSGAVAEAASAPSPSGRRLASDRMHHSVEPTLPGQRLLERFLNRGESPASRDDPPTIRVSYLDVPIDAPDSLALAARRRSPDLTVVPLFLIRCAVVCNREIEPYVKALGAGAFANIPGCGVAGSQP